MIALRGVHSWGGDKVMFSEDVIPGKVRVIAPVDLTLTIERRCVFERAWHAGGRGLNAGIWRLRLCKFGVRSTIQRPTFIVGGRRILIGRNVSVWRHCRLEALKTVEGDGGSIKIDDGTVIQPYAHIGAVRLVQIGRGVLMASNVYITDHDHDISNPEASVTSSKKVIAAPVIIGDNVWLGEGVKVLKGVQIGANSVVGAGSVVTRDIPPNCVAVGVPARVIRRFDSDLKQWISVSPA